MIFPIGATRRTQHQTAANTMYDAVVVGGGISGAIIADELSRAGKRVLVLEAGIGQDHSLEGYEGYLDRFYASASKDNQSPYPPNPNAPMPRSTDAHRIWPGQPDSTGYLVQNGPFATDTTYTRVLGGTTMHWEAKTPRMLPEDFDLHTRYGVGRDWPISYEELMPFYIQAERELGVSAEVEHQTFLGTHFEPGYVYPMHEMPLSYLDQMVGKGIDGTFIELDGEQIELQVRSFPQARNGVPNPAYDGGNGFTPAGAVSTSQVEEGGRCQGNNNCVPICPVQAKYNAAKTLSKALERGNVDLLAQTVGSRVILDPETGRVSGIEVKAYADPNSPRHSTWVVRGRIFVLAASAIENARLMLASGLPSSSGLVGRNLMDHAYLLTWALLPEIAGTFRGTNCTGGITDLRGGSFRRRPGRVRGRHPQRRLGLGHRLAVLGSGHDGRRREPVRRGTAQVAAGPAQPPAAAGLHDRCAAQREQPGHRRPELHRPARQHAPGYLVHRPRILHARRGLRTPVFAAGLPAAGRGRLHPLRRRRSRLPHLRG